MSVMPRLIVGSMTSSQLPLMYFWLNSERAFSVVVGWKKSKAMYFISPSEPSNCMFSMMYSMTGLSS